MPVYYEIQKDAVYSSNNGNNNAETQTVTPNATSSNKVAQLSGDGKNLCWMRHLNVRLYSKIADDFIIYGESRNAEGKYIDSLNISVDGYKKIANASNYGVVAISNLSYEDIIRIIDGEYYKIEIWAGYYMGSFYCYYSGTVAYVSQKISSRKDYTAYITFANEYISSWTQQRLNFNLNSGINLYTAMEYVANRSGVPNVNIDAEFKKYATNKTLNGYGSAKSFVDMLSEVENSIFTNCDSGAWGDVVDITTLDNKATYLITQGSLLMQDSNPTLDKNGLKFKMMPTYNFNVGDVILIDNGLIDISETSVAENRSSFKSMYLDRTMANSQSGFRNYGAYMIRDIHFRFENRGTNFFLEVTAKALSLVQNWFYE